jgi:putative ABC transport system permease protein
MSKKSPPRALRFLEGFCPPELFEGIAGDVLEQYERDLKDYTEGRARRNLWFNVLRFFRPGIILRNKMSIEFINATMLRSYFKLSYRHLAKNKMFAMINILGLATGMAAALLIYEYVHFESSFDSFHKNADDIYRVTTEWNRDVTPEDKRATTVAWSGPGVKEEFPEVIDYARFASVDVFTGFNSVRYQNKEINEHLIFLADPGFLRMFSFPLVSGNAAKALVDPTSVVITESIARKYFGSTDPVGKDLFIDTHGNLAESNFKVTAVIKDPPENSHLDFDFLISFNVIHQGLHNGSTYWHWDYTYAYLHLHPQADIEALEKKISTLRMTQFGKEMQYYKDAIDFKLQPLQDIHLFSSLRAELQMNGDGRALYFLILIGICILLSAYINYVNLSTVKAVERRTEIGIRKVVGSTKRQLTTQLLVESLVLNLLAVTLAFLIFRLSVPVIETVFNMQWPVWDFAFLSADFIGFVFFILLAGIVLSALYPAFVLSSFRPAEVLKGKGPASFADRGWSLRKSLIVLQFVFCIAFSVSTFALFKQMTFMKSYDLGMNLEQVVAVKGYGFQPYKIYEKFKAELSGKTFVKSVGSSSYAPGEEITPLSFKPHIALTSLPGKDQEVRTVMIDDEYLNTIEVEFLAGRNYDQSIKSDAKSVIINEATLKQLGYNDPRDVIGQELTGLEEKPLKIIGVIRNYNQRSLKNDYDPLVFTPIWPDDFGWSQRHFYVRLNPVHDFEQRQEQIAEIQKAWKAVSPEKPFQYFFLDSYFDQQYKSETTFSLLFLFFSGLAIFIACLGLFGLVAYTTLQRTKEIGVRKVLGASVRNILTLLSIDFMKLIMIAILIAIPAVFMALQYWLSQYAFRIMLSLGLFAIPLTLIFLIAMLTVVLRSMKVATANPVDSLRYE